MVKFIAIFVAIAALVSCIYAVPARNTPAYRHDKTNQQPKEAPQPYSFEYKAADEEGNVHHRSELGDVKGTVKGTYGYTDAHGLYRVVEYIADEKGYRATIKTNEPGVDGKESPADVLLTAEQPPAGAQEAKVAQTGYRASAPGPRSSIAQSAPRPAPRLQNRY